MVLVIVSILGAEFLVPCAAQGSYPLIAAEVLVSPSFILFIGMNVESEPSINQYRGVASKWIRVRREPWDYAHTAGTYIKSTSTTQEVEYAIIETKSRFGGKVIFNQEPLMRQVNIGNFFGIAMQ